jgi:hypothetical protein
MTNALARNKKQITIGLDLGDRRHTYCVLDEAGKMAREGSLGNTREQLATMARSYASVTLWSENAAAGTDSTRAQYDYYCNLSLTLLDPSGKAQIADLYPAAKGVAEATPFVASVK